MKDWTKTHEELERKGAFDTFTIPSNTDNLLPVDENYVYLDGRLRMRVLRVLCVAVLTVFGPVLTFFWFGVRIRGRKKLKGLPAAVTVSNHVLILDTLLVKQTFGFARCYLTGGAHNSKRGLGGAILRAGGFLPLPTCLSAARKSEAALAGLLAKGKFVHFYPEQALWAGYEKPRPFKKGAFLQAAGNEVPVVPMHILFHGKKGLRKWLHLPRRVEIRVLDPIFPQPGLTRAQNAEAMRRRAEEAFRRSYEDFYGRPLTFLNEEKKSA